MSIYLFFNLTIYYMEHKGRLTLLSLVPLFCMVAPIRDLGNKSSFTMTNMSLTLTFELPTVSSTINIGMDLPSGSYPDNYDNVRGRTPFTNKNTSRNLSMSFTISSVVYYERMAYNNGTDDNVDMKNNSPTLSYEDKQEKTL